jgi:hypothetical protein
MREYDDDSIQHYAPVLRRILILLAVIIAVPVALWTITAFMRTYIAQPTIPDARPLLPVASAAPTSTTTDTASSPPPATSVASAPAAPSAPAAADSAGADTPSTASIPGGRVATAQPGSPWPASPAAAAPTAPAPAAAAPSVFPAPPAMSAQQTQPAPDAAAPDTAADDALPPPDPITGPVPMPRHRPSILALADGAIPLPRARPAAAPEPPKTEIETPAYDPGIGGVSGAH